MKRYQTFILLFIHLKCLLFVLILHDNWEHSPYERTLLNELLEYEFMGGFILFFIVLFFKFKHPFNKLKLLFSITLLNAVTLAGLMITAMPFYL